MPIVLACLIKLFFHTIHKRTVCISPPSVSLKEDDTKEVSESKHISTLIFVHLLKNCYLIIFDFKNLLHMPNAHLVLFVHARHSKKPNLSRGEFEA